MAGNPVGPKEFLVAIGPIQVLYPKGKKRLPRGDDWRRILD
jgi:hypothetical protein